jgi:hypothetical protein
METQLYTRNSLTGAILMLAFVLLWLPSHCSYNLTMNINCKNKNNSTAVVALITAVLSTPFIGFIIGTLVQGLWYLVFGQPYNDEARKKFKEDVIERLSKKEGNEDKDLICNMSAPDVFNFFYYRFAPSELIEWSRRRRTAELLGYNWTAAIIVGVVIGLAINGKWYNGKLLAIICLCLIVFFSLLVSQKAKNEANRVEQLWSKNFLNKDFSEQFLAGLEAPPTKESSVNP